MDRVLMVSLCGQIILGPNLDRGVYSFFMRTYNTRTKLGQKVYDFCMRTKKY